MSEMLGELHGGNPSEGAGRCKVGQDKSHDAKRVSDERSISVYSGILRPVRLEGGGAEFKLSDVHRRLGDMRRKVFDELSRPTFFLDLPCD